jgi:hypothetical protein
MRLSCIDFNSSKKASIKIKSCLFYNDCSDCAVEGMRLFTQTITLACHCSNVKSCHYFWLSLENQSGLERGFWWNSGPLREKATVQSLSEHSWGKFQVWAYSWQNKYYLTLWSFHRIYFKWWSSSFFLLFHPPSSLPFCLSLLPLPQIYIYKLNIFPHFPCAVASLSSEPLFLLSLSFPFSV